MQIDSISSRNSSGDYLGVLHLWQRIGYKLPIVGSIGRAFWRRSAKRDRLRPRLIFGNARTGRCPRPIESRAIQPLSRSGRVVLVSYLRFDSRNCLFLLHFPSRVCIGHTLGGGFAMHKKSDTLAHLPNRSVCSKIPHRGDQNVVSRVQQRTEVISLISPVCQVAVTRPTACPLLVYIENEFVISEQTPVTAPLRCALGAGIITDHLASVVEQANHSSI